MTARDFHPGQPVQLRIIVPGVSDFSPLTFCGVETWENATFTGRDHRGHPCVQRADGSELKLFSDRDIR